MNDCVPAGIWAYVAGVSTVPVLVVVLITVWWVQHRRTP